MAKKILLNGAVGPIRECYFLLLDDRKSDEDESLFALARREGDTLEVTPLSGLEEIVSVETLEGHGFDGAIVCALTADGKLLFSDGDRFWSEVVPKKASGRLRKVRYLNGVLYVSGFGGQVYRRREDEAWEDISFEVPDLVGGHALFYHVVHGPSGDPIFAGIYLHVRQVTDAMKAASAAGDTKLFIELKRATKKTDHMLVAEYRGGWHVLFTNHPGVVSWLSPSEGGGFYLVSQSGTVWETRDFLDLEERWVPENPAAFTDIQVYKGSPVFLRGGALWGLGSEVPFKFEPSLPDLASSPLGLWSCDGSLITVHRDGIWSLDEDGWKQLELRLASSH